jgi:hypothetical protein
MRQRRSPTQTRLFEQTPAVLAVQLPEEVRERLKHALTQWLQSLAKSLREVRGDE